MPRRIRIAIVGASPCGQCWAACCKQNGHEYAALLQTDAERRRFAAFSQRVQIHDGQRMIVEQVLPYVGGRCQFLGDDDLCTIYDDRPLSCRQFECVRFYDEAHGHGRFLHLNPRVKELLDQLPNPP